MYRYMGIVWNPLDRNLESQALALAQYLETSSDDWRCAFAGRGLRVFDHHSRACGINTYRFINETGVVIGNLFHKAVGAERGPVDLALSYDVTQDIVQTRAKCLVDRYWGRYIAFLWDSVTRRHYVLRDPTGAFPCIYTNCQGAFVFMSDLEDFIPLKAGVRTVNWRYVSALFWSLRTISRDTGFDGVFRLHAGECLTVQQGSLSSAFHWNPVSLVDGRAAPPLEESEHAQATLRTTIQSCVSAWASCHDSVIHQLSGGLDSAIVAACLSSVKDKRRTTCVNFHTDTPEGDERSFARLIARKFGLELIEAAWRSSDRPLEAMLKTGRYDAPYGLKSKTEALLQRLSLERRATVIFTGQGGDQLFQHRRDVLIPVEYIRRNGLGTELFKVMLDTSRLTKQSVWNVLAAALPYVILNRQLDPYAVHKQSALLTDEARATLSPDLIRHPWLDDVGRLPPSKVQQIYDVIDTQFFYLRPVSFADMIHPLVSQPIIECALRIPTYLLTHDGIGRALVRQAFSQELPVQIIQRTTKGETSGYLNRLLVENTGFVRSYLLDGLLVSEGILSKPALERQLSPNALIRGDHLFDLFTAVRTEAWLQSWTGVWQRALHTPATN